MVGTTNLELEKDVNGVLNIFKTFDERMLEVEKRIPKSEKRQDETFEKSERKYDQQFYRVLASICNLK